MKTIILYFFTITFSSLFIAYNREDITPNNSSLPKAFKKSYGGVNYEHGAGIMQLPNNDFAILGTIQTEESDYDLYFSRVNEFGQVILTTTFGTVGASEYAMSLEPCLDGSGDFIVLTYKSSVEGEVYRISSEGEIIWRKTKDLSLNGLNHLATTERGFCILNQHELLYFDYDGNQIGSTQFEDELSNYDSQSFDNSMFSVIAVEGSYAICGTKFQEEGGAFYPVALVAMLSSSGTLIWEKTYRGIGYALSYTLASTENSILITGTTALLSNDAEVELLVIEADIENGEQLYLESKRVGVETIGISITSLDEGYVVVASTEIPTSLSDSQDNAYISKFSQCNLAWERQCGGISEESVRKVIMTNDGGIAAIGSTSSFGGGDSDILLIRLNLDGSLR